MLMVVVGEVCFQTVHTGAAQLLSIPIVRMHTRGYTRHHAGTQSVGFLL